MYSKSSRPTWFMLSSPPSLPKRIAPDKSSTVIVPAQIVPVGRAVVSLSAIVTVAVARLPSIYPDGSVPNESATDSPSSSIASSVAVTVRGLVVCPEKNVRLDGTLE